MISKIKKYPEVFLYVSFVLYLGLVWLFHLIEVSIVNFFHFQLSHGLSVIEKWMGYNAWEVIIVCKLAAFFVCYKYFVIHLNERRPVRKLLSLGMSIPHYSFFAIILLVYSVVLFFRPEEATGMNDQIYSLRSYFFEFIFYLIDLGLIYLILNHYKGKKISQIKILLFQIISSCLLVYFYNKTFLYVDNFGVIFVFNFLIALRLMIYRKLNWTLPILYLIACAIPLTLILNLDPVLLEIENQAGQAPDIFILITLVLIVMTYLFIQEKRLLRTEVSH